MGSEALILRLLLRLQYLSLPFRSLVGRANLEINEILAYAGLPFLVES